MTRSEHTIIQRMLELFTRVTSTQDARRQVLEIVADASASSGHLVDLTVLQKGTLSDIRYGPLMQEKNFGADLDRFLWSNPILPYLPLLKEQRSFLQSEIVGGRLWYGSAYYNDFFRPYGHDHSLVLLFQQSQYGLATVLPRGQRYAKRTMHFLNHIHPLMEHGLLNLNQWEDRWLSAGAVQRIADSTTEFIAAIRAGKLLAVTGPARAALGLDAHGEERNLWVGEFLLAANKAARLEPLGPFQSATGQFFKLTATHAPKVDGPVNGNGNGNGDSEAVLLVKMEPLSLLPLDVARMQSRARDMGLSEREAHVMALVASGASLRDIAGVMGIRYNTIRAHLRNAYTKLRVTNRIAAANVLQTISE